jgi:H+-transporting ATPase
VSTSDATAKKRSFSRELLAHLSGPLPWLLEAAVVLSLFVGDWTLFTMLSLILLVTVVLGFWEKRLFESSAPAGGATEEAKRRSAPGQPRTSR